MTPEIIQSVAESPVEVPSAEVSHPITEASPQIVQQEINVLKQQIENARNPETTEVKEFLTDYNKLFEKKFGLSVPDKNLPNVEINPEADHVSYSGGIDENGNKLNVIEVHKAEDVFGWECNGRGDEPFLSKAIATRVNRNINR